MIVDVDNDDSIFNLLIGVFFIIFVGSKVKKVYLFWIVVMGMLIYLFKEYRVSDVDVREFVKMKMGNKGYVEVSVDSIWKVDYLLYILNYLGVGVGYVVYVDVINVIV